MNKTIVSVNLPQSPYDVVITAGGLALLGPWLSGETPLLKPGQKLLLVSNPVIFRLYGETVIRSLEQAGFEISTCILPAGERYKTLKSIQKIYDAAYEHRLERQSAMVALGGGVVGDMTGFAAATWLRGIAFIQLPTSLLAMVDASVGGKTGVNHPQGKNLIGAFHQPRLVMIDPEVLRTLPGREFRAGMAEVIKYGVIWDAHLFEQLEAAPRLDQARYMSADLLQTVLQASCAAKAEVVIQDEKESGLRAILNYGHTIAHAVESITRYRSVNHGEAVAIGMVAAGAIATRLSLWDTESEARQLALLQKAQLPTRLLPEAVHIDGIIDLLQSDKKVLNGRVRFVLPTGIGQVKITDEVPPAIIREVLQDLLPA